MQALRFVIVCAATVFVSAALFLFAINFLDWISIQRHGDIGVGGGFSIAMASVLLSALAMVFLFLVTVFAQLYTHVRIVPKWPLARGHFLVLLTWAVLLVAFAVLLAI